MNEHLHFQINFDITSHPVDVDFNDERVRAHLAALVRRGGSTTENIVIGFVLSDPSYFEGFRTIQDAWLRLDHEQRDCVLAFRNLMKRPFLGSPDEDFPHLVYVECVVKAYRDFLEKEEDERGAYSGPS